MPLAKKKSARKRRKRKPKGSVQVLDETSRRFAGSFTPTNVREQKERFLKYGLSPEFAFSNGRKAEDVERLMVQNTRQAIHNEYLRHAKAILEKVKDEYEDGMRLVHEMFGNSITQETATEYIKDYIKQHDLSGEIAIYWSPTLTGSAKMVWRGPVAKANKPDQRHFSLVVKNTPDNLYLSEVGIKCLMNHEIGTHYFRAYNDGFQPWYSDRKRFGLDGYSSRSSVASEEGLACLNSVISARSKYLWGAALCYYTSCMANEMTFEELFTHLEQYVANRDYRWKLCLRVKRALSNTDCCGGIGHDQVYFEGAANILTNLDDVDLLAMFCGRVSYDQTTRVRRIAHTECIRLPGFMKDLDRYKHLLRFIAYVNGLGDKPNMLATPERRLQKSDSAKFNYEAHKLKRDGKTRRKDDVSDMSSSFMCFVYSDSPVPRRPMTSRTTRSRLSQNTPEIARTQSNNSKVFIYPLSPVPDAHYIKLRDLLHPDLNLDFDISRSVDKAPVAASQSDRGVGFKQQRALPDVHTASDRWHKR